METFIGGRGAPEPRRRGRTVPSTPRRGAVPAVLLLVVAMVAAILAVGPPAPAGAAGPQPEPPQAASFGELRSDLEAQLPAAPGAIRSMMDHVDRGRAAFEAQRPCGATDALLDLLDAAHSVRMSLPEHRRAAIEAIRTRAWLLRFAILRELPRGQACGGGVEMLVDPTVTPESPEPAGYEAPGTTRPLGAVLSARDNRSDFVLDELVVLADPTFDRAAFVDRWGATLIASAPVAEATTLELHRVDLSRVDLDAIEPTLERINGGIPGMLRFSSERALRTFGAAVLAVDAGFPATLAVTMALDGYVDRRVTEGAPLAPGAGSSTRWNESTFQTTGAFTPDPYDWVHLMDGGVQDTGVAEAWTLLERAGVERQVGLAAVDDGFVPDFSGDLPSGLYVSGVPFSAPTGEAIGGGYHGTSVLGTAVAIANNGVGSAGTAGRWAFPYGAVAGVDPFTIGAALGQIWALPGPAVRVINISQSMRFDAVFAAALVPPWEALFDLITSGGRVVIATPGNTDDDDPDQYDIDATDCLDLNPFSSGCQGPSWEEETTVPCEFSGVLCVGGIDHRSVALDPGSMYGHESVRMFAPYEVLVPGDPRFPGPGPHAVIGTSFAAPFVAGVVAMVLAADPSLDEDAVFDLLFRTAHPGSGNVTRRINAYDAVAQALPIRINILSPANGTAYPSSGNVPLSAFVHAKGTAGEVRWYEGTTLVGTGTSTSARLPQGAHRLEARYTWSGGSVSDFVDITVTSTPPTVRIDTPTGGQRFGTNQVIPLQGSSSDVDLGGGPLPDSQVRWLVDGVERARGHQASIAAGVIPAGRHTLTFEGNDGTSIATASITFDVETRTLPPAPALLITEPANGAELFAGQYDALRRQYYAFTNLRVQVLGGTPVTYRWYVTRTGGQRELASVVRDASARLYLVSSACNGDRYTIEVEATDALGQTSTARTGVLVYGIC